MARAQDAKVAVPIGKVADSQTYAFVDDTTPQYCSTAGAEIITAAGLVNLPGQVSDDY